MSFMRASFTRRTWLVAAAASAFGPACLGQVVSQSADAVVLVQPTGDLAYVAIVFARDIPHAAVKLRIDRLAKAAGWAYKNVEVNDVAARVIPGSTLTAHAKETDAAFVVTSGLHVRDDAFQSGLQAPAPVNTSSR